ncbi:LR74A-like protein [Mya arenaria]|uniref:LR74A-like protein n=1 Tax=Mya arenaria TaxID=6604 RepID=A0ABY7FC13_MYAAR|nr:LR74A-like protein [Mya arenaria]
MSIKAETISLRPRMLREETLLEDPPRKYMEPHEVKMKLYLKECERLQVIPVSAYVRKPTSTALCLQHYNMGPNGARALSAALLLDTTISFLDIEGNSITSIGLSSIKEALVDHNFITHLNISDNKLGSRGAVLLEQLMLANHRIDTLHASRNGFKDADAEYFAHMIKENVGLKKLDVSFNGFGTEGTAFMGQALATNRTLLELDMSKNRITNFDLKVMVKQLAQNDTLQVLRLGDNLINALGAIDVLQTVLALETSSMEKIDFGNVYIDLDMKPPEENPDQILSEFSGRTPDDALSDVDKAEKGKTYVVENTTDENDNDDHEKQTRKPGSNKEKNELIEHNEHELDAEVLAVTGEPQTQMALVDERDGAGTVTPDI